MDGTARAAGLAVSGSRRGADRRLLPIGTALALVHDLGVRDRDQASDLLAGMALTSSGGPLAWDRIGHGRLLRPTQPDRSDAPPVRDSGHQDRGKRSGPP